MKRIDHLQKSYGTYSLSPDQRMISQGNALPNAPATKPEHNRRGINVYSPSQIMGLMGIDQTGDRHSVSIEYPSNYLSIDQRVSPEPSAGCSGSIVRVVKR